MRGASQDTGTRVRRKERLGKTRRNAAPEGSGLGGGPPQPPRRKPRGGQKRRTLGHGRPDQARVAPGGQNGTVVRECVLRTSTPPHREEGGIVGRIGRPATALAIAQEPLGSQSPSRRGGAPEW